MLGLWWRGLASLRARSLLSVAAIALGVALGFGVQLLHGVAVEEMSLAVVRLSGDADLSVTGPRMGLPEGLYGRLAALPEVAAASPVLQGEVRLQGHPGHFPLLGLDAFQAQAVQPRLVGRPRERLDLLRGDRVFITPALAAELGEHTEGTLRLQQGLAYRELRVAGEIAGAAPGERLLVVDIAAAQQLFHRFGYLSAVHLRLAPGVSAPEFARRLQAELPPGVEVGSPAAAGQRQAALSRAYRVNLQVLALVSLFTGGLLVFSTQALSVLARRPQLALLRVLGLPAKRLLVLVLAEGAGLGVLGSALGLLAGWLLAAALLWRFGAGLGNASLSGTGSLPWPEPWSALVFLLLGTAAAAAGSLAPALEAARMEPGRALKAGDEQRMLAPLQHPLPGLAALAVAVLLLTLPPLGGLPIFAYAAIALLLLGSIVLLPRALAATLAFLPGHGGVPERLSLAQLRAAPGPAGIGLAALVASVALAVSMAVMVDSFRDSLAEWLEVVLPADLYLRLGEGADGSFLDSLAQRRLAGLPGVARVEFLRTTQILLDHTHPPVTLLARDFPSDRPQAHLPLVSGFTPPGPGEQALFISEYVADVFALRVGDRVKLPLPLAGLPFRVAGVWRDYARQGGALVLDRAVYARLAGDTDATEARLWGRPGVSAALLAAQVRECLGSLPSQGELVEPGELRSFSLRLFDRTFAVTYALEAAAILIGLAGLSGSLAAQVLARRREFALLRHLGLRRGQVLRMLTSGTALVTGFGLALGCLLGLLVSLILVHVVNRQSFHWSMDLHVPWAGLALFLAVLLGSALATAAWAGRQALGREVLRSVRED